MQTCNIRPLSFCAMSIVGNRKMTTVVQLVLTMHTPLIQYLKKVNNTFLMIIVAFQRSQEALE